MSSTAGIARIAHSAIKADHIKGIFFAGDNLALHWLDMDGKKHSLGGTTGEDFEKAIETWQAALSNLTGTKRPKPDKPAKPSRSKKKTSSKTRQTEPSEATETE